MASRREIRQAARAPTKNRCRAPPFTWSSSAGHGDQRNLATTTSSNGMLRSALDPRWCHTSSFFVTSAESKRARRSRWSKNSRCPSATTNSPRNRARFHDEPASKPTARQVLIRKPPRLTSHRPTRRTPRIARSAAVLPRFGTIASTGDPASSRSFPFWKTASRCAANETEDAPHHRSHQHARNANLSDHTVRTPDSIWIWMVSLKVAFHALVIKCSAMVKAIINSAEFNRKNDYQNRSDHHNHSRYKQKETQATPLA